MPSGAAPAPAQDKLNPQELAKQLKLRAVACKRKGQLTEAKKLLIEAKQIEKEQAAKQGSTEDIELMQQLHELGWQGGVPGKQVRSPRQLPHPEDELH